MADIGFALNFTHYFEIDITPEADAHTWARVAAGIKTVTPSSNETTSEDTYYDGGGESSSEVTGNGMTLSFSGDRKYGDPAQDFVVARSRMKGEKRHTTLRWTEPNGDITEGDVTLQGITAGLGDANAKGSFSFDAHFNGTPDFAEGDVSTWPESISATAVSVKVGATAAVNPTVTPSTASQTVAFAIKDDSIAIVDSSGNVKGIKAGTTEVKVQSVTLPSVYTTAKVTVTTA